MRKFALEVCADSVESVLAGAEGGATRIELCSNVMIGGTSPSPKLYEEIRKYTRIPVHVLIRPRGGDFCYSSYELSVIKEEILMFKNMGVQGVVIGVLNPNGELNREQLEVLVACAQGLSITLHRAFDLSKDPFKTMEDAIDLGIHEILTSGQKNTCYQGIELLRLLNGKSDGRISLIAGGGLKTKEIEALHNYTGIRNFHMTGKVYIDSKMVYRRKEIELGVSSILDYTLIQTQKEEVIKAKNVLEKLTLNNKKTFELESKY